MFNIPSAFGLSLLTVLIPVLFICRYYDTPAFLFVFDYPEALVDANPHICLYWIYQKLASLKQILNAPFIDIPWLSQAKNVTKPIRVSPN